MSEMQRREVPLKPGMIQFLEDTVRKYNLEDQGKALRCLINYARENPDKDRKSTRLNSSH